MRKLIRSILFTPSQFNKLSICNNHIKHDQNHKPIINIKQPIPYSKDHCITCSQYICHVCSQTHIAKNCHVQLDTLKQYGSGIVKALNYDIKCICGKPLNRSSAICAACGMASCSEACHKEWEKLGNCKFGEQFYSIPEGSTLRSIVFDNIRKIQEANIPEWYIANKTSTSMLCAYASSSQPYIYLQRGYRIYGNPNISQPQLINNMQLPQKQGLDYYIHFDRLCDCNCSNCQLHPGHSSTNCQTNCRNFDYQFMKIAVMNSKNHKQCTCSCQFCNSGVIFNTHRLIDCMVFCKRSQLHRNK